jgi:demethylmenaquinone methyltransferase/2-methoxy-6-polyprenyl-1,4-benzoquinol methylase
MVSPGTAPHPILSDYYHSPEDRRPFVSDLFDRTAAQYEWVCRVMSFGSGGRYRRQALERAGLAEGMKVLDVATGTGLVARAAAEIVGDPRRVVGLDASRPMLLESKKGLSNPLVLSVGERLPFAGEQFDFLAMGYALRHLAELEPTFSEYRRVLKPGGRVLLLEISRPESRLGRALVGAYLTRLVPFFAGFGGGRSGVRLLMRYYWDTIEQCVAPPAILNALRASGFRQVERRLMFHLFSEYVAVK